MYCHQRNRTHNYSILWDVTGIFKRFREWFRRPFRDFDVLYTEWMYGRFDDAYLSLFLFVFALITRSNDVVTNTHSMKIMHEFICCIILCWRVRIKWCAYYMIITELLISQSRWQGFNMASCDSLTDVNIISQVLQQRYYEKDPLRCWTIRQMAQINKDSSITANTRDF